MNSFRLRGPEQKEPESHHEHNYLRIPGQHLGQQSLQLGQGGLQCPDGLGPEPDVLEIAAQCPARDALGAVAAGEAEEFLVAREKTGPFLLEHGIQAAAEQKAEGVGGEVVEGHPGDVEMEFRGPEVGVFSSPGERLPQDVALEFRPSAP